MQESVENTNWPDDGYISKLEMARRLDVRIRTIEVWMRQKKVSYEKIGRTVRFNWGDVRTYLSRHNRIPAQPEEPLRLIEGTSSRLKELAAVIRKQHRE
jgi:excisionase family DNA binding protein